jgi:hypothetical protein
MNKTDIRRRLNANSRFNSDIQFSPLPGLSDYCRALLKLRENTVRSFGVRQLAAAFLPTSVLVGTLDFSPIQVGSRIPPRKLARGDFKIHHTASQFLLASTRDRSREFQLRARYAAGKLAWVKAAASCRTLKLRTECQRVMNPGLLLDDFYRP